MGRHYSKNSSRPSGKFYSPVVRQRVYGTQASQLSKSQTSQTLLKNSHRHSNLPHRTKMPQTTSLKRPATHGEDDNLRPFKKLIVEVQDHILDDLSIRSESSTTSSEVRQYQRRRRIAKPVDSDAMRAMVSKIDSSWAGMPVNAQNGMANITGATCYRISLLQALLHQPLFVHWILECHRPENCVSDYTESCVTCILRSLTLEYWTRFQSGTQKILSGMHTTFKELGWASDVTHGHADPEDQMTWVWRMLRAEIPSTIFGCLEAIMQPVLSTVVQCPGCGHESRTNGHQELTIPIDIYPVMARGTLADYLKRHMTETIFGYRCDGCGNSDEKHPKYRKQLITFGPEILAVQLKRINPFDLTRKLTAHVAINPTLDFNAYRDADLKDQLNYELNAIIKHGGKPSAGHYISFAKGADGVWFQYNDARKSKSTFAAAVSSDSGFTSYFMFYKRK